MPALMFAIGVDPYRNVIPGPSGARSPESTIAGFEYRYEPGNQKTVVMDSGTSSASRNDDYSASAVSCFALAIQPSTRPGSPTSSPTLWAAVGDSSAICV